MRPEKRLTVSGLLGSMTLLCAGLAWAGEASPPKTSQPTSADKLGVEQQAIADNFQHLQDVLLRMAELSEKTDPSRAVLLRKAVRQSEERLIGVQFDKLVDLLAKDRLSRAIENQDNLQQDLRVLLELLLSENRARRLESEKARIAEYLKRLNRIIKQQKGIQGRTAGGGEPGPLSNEQEKLANNPGELAKDVQEDDQQDDEAAAGSTEEGTPDSNQEKPPEREPEEEGDKPPKENGKGEPNGKSPQPAGGEESGQPQDSSEGPSAEKTQGQGRPAAQGQEQNPAQQRIEAAESRMREAQQKLEEAERQAATKAQEEAIRELEEAKIELEEILRQFREEEIERTLALLETRFRKMLGLQREVYEGTLRLDKVPQPERTHNHEIESSRLSRKETEIVLEASKALALLREDGTAVAFPEAVEDVRQDMDDVARRLDRTEVGPMTQVIEEEIIAALEEMLKALEQAKDDAEEGREPQPMQPGQPQDQALVDLLAEIKMIRAMQMRVNRRTDRYSKLIDGEEAEKPDLVEALGKLAERQERIHEITRNLEMGRNR